MVFNHSDKPVGVFFASKNLNEITKRDFSFDITFESPKYDEVMSNILMKQDIIQGWLAEVDATMCF